MAALELKVVGEVPGDLDLAPLEAVIGMAVTRAEELELPEGVVNLAFGDDEAVRVLNREHAGNDYATDVLSFSYLETGGAIDGVIGEMIISLDTAARQADVAETPLGVEVALLALHGLLHISGYDHQNDAERARIEAIQSDIMVTSGYTYRDFKWEK